MLLPDVTPDMLLLALGVAGALAGGWVAWGARRIGPVRRGGAVGQWQPHEPNDVLVLQQADLAPAPPSPALQALQAEAQALQAQLTQQAQKWHDFANSSTDWLWETDAQGAFSYVSPGALQVLGYPPQSLLGKPLLEVLFAAPDEPARLLLMGRVEHQQPYRDIEFWSTNTKLEKVCLRITGVPVRNEAGAVGYRGAITNVTAQKKEREEVNRLAKTDHLTGLLNVHRFREELERAIQASRRHQTTGVVLFIDLDRFKEINDTHGHEAGDQMLRGIAKIISETTRITDITARRGGDEFSIVMHNIDLPTATQKVHAMLAKVAAFSLEYRGTRLSTTMSVGMVQYPQEDKSAEHLIMSADLAMYRAKDMGRNRLYVDDSAATEETVGSVRNQLKWLERLKHCLETGDFQMFFQAIVPARPHQRPLFEALLRIFDEDGKGVSPALFIDAAEHFGLIQKLDLAVVDRVFAMQAELRREQVVMDVSINLSCRTLGDPAVMPRLRELMALHAVDPSTIIFEVTETMALHDPAQIRDINDIKHFIEELRGMGFRFALDDFGSGFTSFRYLKILPVDVVKIDGEYIKNLAHSVEDQIFVKSMVDLCQGLGIKTIAEFVEDEEGVAKLLEYGVDYGQGWHFAKPQADLKALVATYQDRVMDDYRIKPLLVQGVGKP
jgi:diguanylate cyclase (GGDEF)-like protein/PAS domain S-box-containing protein